MTAATTLAAMPVIAMILSLSYRGLEENLGGIITLVLFVLPLILILVCLLSGMPAALVILFGEALRIRSVLFYVPAGAAIGAFIWRITVGANHPLGLLFGLAGALAGIAYWFAAGKYAGEEGQPER
ncbi:hypothetical protein JQ582_28975 [Bradyrhizobium japonicum]|uniref:hypothetical protein n=1 Tax=Bradyrhizobium japonicum TaxID=375 RepID=UPI001BA837C1|nr:hypothetical protein [Bradyrhizobium japonicum]MBR0747978.1 hypothetical protein [Bradyrhizobium japonicum]